VALRSALSLQVGAEISRVLQEADKP